MSTLSVVAIVFFCILWQDFSANSDGTMEIPSELKLQRRTIELEAKEKGGKQGEKGKILAEDSSEQPAAQPLASKQTKQTDNRCINKGRQIEQVKSGRCPLPLLLCFALLVSVLFCKMSDTMTNKWSSLGWVTQGKGTIKVQLQEVPSRRKGKIREVL
ncbi:hypothetical protein RUM43_003499 [Polyplax serrata]|uniref:Uncharacterized protein n=1 Tax=Polyplax serrata TaxID=468196 RepID=A0AAN8PHF4_POLSC